MYRDETREWIIAISIAGFSIHTISTLGFPVVGGVVSFIAAAVLTALAVMDFRDTGDEDGFDE